MYKALVARVRYHIQKANFMGLKEAESTLLLGEAADAIEELTADLERSKEWEGFWKEQAEEAKGNLQQYALADANKPQWIPVTERLPKPETDVLSFRIYGSFSQMSEITMNEMKKNGEWCYEGVTHWMPLPEPPKDKT